VCPVPSLAEESSSYGETIFVTTPATDTTNPRRFTTLSPATRKTHQGESFSWMTTLIMCSMCSTSLPHASWRLCLVGGCGWTEEAAAVGEDQTDLQNNNDLPVTHRRKAESETTTIVSCWYPPPEGGKSEAHDPNLLQLVLHIAAASTTTTTTTRSRAQGPSVWGTGEKDPTQDQ